MQKKKLSKRQSHSHTERIEIPIFAERSVVFYFTDKERFIKEVYDYLNYHTEIDEDVTGRTVLRDGYSPCVWINPNRKGHEKTITIAHESIHAVLHIMRRLGMNTEEDTGDEFLAYAVETIMRELIKNK